ncbi:hypothetical protein FZI85_29910 [Mycobacterium sp. CBMA293]|uniref:hypothetical protein n=1 Tax=unclassified Mycolicibacterium TaxID=2636767 RepID=UPI0012DD6B0D|nr:MULTISPECIES: hypothetical protein [unclassified Mycolicibacterium]QGT51765.1 hypothetical protein pCBMA213_3_00023 [Mycolicibacterium sp.]MUL50054.1 hypothetical protein [Mycolicibacterium sp. CBMA 360]MUL62746.1 hypothetical protein [Mycolicibacterium sp. CBMA 335]MUL69610.1 hypothetical protein [Mycolicibacterium sp. CBMA 311]MUL97396.1 hypothetical protein [Mycolicibacterium sp. CBMA 230]
MSNVLTCPSTGLALVPASGQTVFRLARPSYGALNPRRRTATSDDDRSEWNRFDLAGHQTVYAASTPEGAYGELLGSLKKPAQFPGSRLFDDAGTATMEELIAQDWAEAGKRLAPCEVDINWLYEFRMYTMTLPVGGWLVDSEHSRTVSYLQQNIPLAVWERSVHQVTVSVLRCEDRFITSHLAERLAGARLAEGDKAIGLRYGSKHGSDWDCWTVWLRGGVAASIAVDDGTPVQAPESNPVLAKVLDTYGLLAL